MSVDTLLNFNGVDGSSVFTDDGLDPLVFSVLEGTPVLTTSEQKFGTASLSIDGISSIESPNINIANDWTIECWFKTNSVPANGVYAVIINTSLNTISGISLRGDASGTVDLTLSTEFSSGQVQPIGKVELNVWNHVALVKKGNYFNCVYNGLPTGESVLAVSGATFGLEKIILGSSAFGDQNFTGFIDGFRFTKDEILYNILTRPSDVPVSELDTTTVQPPVLPTAHSLFTDEIKNSDTSVNSIFTLEGSTILGGTGSGAPVEPPATTTNMISGNVKKLGLPFGANVVCISLGVNAKVVGTGASDEITGDYSIDIYPHTEEVLIYVAPEYGTSFTPSSFVGLDQIIHPTIPNRYVYICTVAGTTGGVEPTWGIQGLINSGSSTFNTLPLHRPLMNGFIKPVITPI